MCIPVHSPWLPGYIDVTQTIPVIVTMARLFPDRSCMLDSPAMLHSTPYFSNHLCSCNQLLERSSCLPCSRSFMNEGVISVFSNAESPAPNSVWHIAVAQQVYANYCFLICTAVLRGRTPSGKMGNKIKRKTAGKGSV